MVRVNLGVMVDGNRGPLPATIERSLILRNCGLICRDSGDSLLWLFIGGRQYFTIVATIED